MEENNKKNYKRTWRMTWLYRLNECLCYLGYKSPEAEHTAWIKERELTVLALRDICKDYGDNDWPDDLFLADVIKKHLRRHLDPNKRW